MSQTSGKTLYLPGLNGIRAIASIGVVISHITLALTSFNLNGHPFGENAQGGAKGYSLAAYGVTMFFVLSGFLITYLLRQESEKQKIDIRKFYIRRILRIWPLYYVYLMLCIIVILGMHLEVQTGTLLYYLFFAANIASSLNLDFPYAGHFWSLGVEEQFYLFWPWIIKMVRKNVVALIIGLIALQLGIRVILWYLHPHSPLAEFSLLNRFDCMMLGGLGALLYKQKHKLFLKLIDNKFSQAVALSILALIIVNKFYINAVVDNSIVAVITLIIIVGQINKKNRLVSFENPVFDFLGKISFGIYVYHPLLILLFSKLYAPITGESTFKYLLVYISILLATIACAYISYTYFESWFIRRKKKFTIVQSSGSREEAEHNS